MIQEWLDGSIHIFYRGKEVAYEERAEMPTKVKKPLRISATRIPFKPPADHPWRRYKNKLMLVASP
jgi:hypothetical protein